MPPQCVEEQVIVNIAFLTDLSPDDVAKHFIFITENRSFIIRDNQLLQHQKEELHVSFKALIGLSF